MKALLPFVALALLVTGAHAAQSDALKVGKLQCYMPNTTKHTCVAISGYTFGATITNQANVLLSPAPLVTMKTDSVVTFNGEVICGRIEKADIDRAVISVDGAPLPEDKAPQAHANVWAAFASRAGKLVCTTYTPAADDSFTATTTLDGAPDTTVPPITVILVDPKDGYTIGVPN